jgi:muconate cycloisomerase
VPLVSGAVYALSIPFIESFRHSLHERGESDSVILVLRDELGNEGFGEAAPRPYVTGETVAFVVERLSTHYWPALVAKALPPPDLLEIERFAGETSDGTSDNATRAALTTALIDLVLKREPAGIATLLPPVRDKVRYSGVITASAPEKAAATARKLRVIGIKDVKIKVGFSDDVERVAAVREVIGPDGSIRLDANGAWDVPQAVRKLGELEAFDIAAVEQPLARGDVARLLQLKAQTAVPLMADESLVSPADARALSEKHAVDYFNIRVSKCGGLARCAQIAKIAAEAGIGVQIGSQVGETAILSAAGRALAAWVPELAFAEGSFGDLLLVEDVVQRSVRFGFAGDAPVLKGPGLGIDVDSARLAKYAVREVAL